MGLSYYSILYTSIYLIEFLLGHVSNATRATMTLPALDKPPFAIDNLPYGVIKTDSDPNPRCAIAIGEHALDLAQYARAGTLASLEKGHNFKLEKLFAEVGELLPKLTPSIGIFA